MDKSRLFETEDWSHRKTVVPIMILFTSFIIWASFFEIDEVVKGTGKVVPSSQTKIIQNFEGGIVSKIHVKEGDTVAIGDSLYSLKNAAFKADLKSKQHEMLSLQAARTRISALIEGKTTLVFDPVVFVNLENVTENEIKIFEEDKKILLDKINIANDQKEQRFLKLEDAKRRFENLEIEYKLSIENFTIQEELYRKNVVSKAKYIEEMLKKQSIFTKLEESRNSIPIAMKEYEESTKKLEAVTNEEKQKYLIKLSSLNIEINKLKEGVNANTDREARKEVISPVKGVVNKLYFNTVDGIVKAGDNIAEITPIEDSLTIESKIRTSDRAFIWPGQKVSIEITAYDFSKYGLLEGKILSVSADSFEEEGFTYYVAKIQANEVQFAENLPILPGMIANTNILTGKKSIMRYLLKPLKDIQKNAFSEN